MVSVRSRLPEDGVLEPIDLNAWIEMIDADYTRTQLDVIQRALVTAAVAHTGQTRASGSPYIHHSLTVADILVDLGMDHETVAAAILHDVVEDTSVTLQDIHDEFGPSIAHLVDGVTKMAHLPEYHADEAISRYAESLRKMLLAMAQDVRVVLIKLADRLHNMRTLKWLSQERQKRIAQETRDIYAPLANRLGIWQIKWELEDLSFRYLEPDVYKRVAKLLDEKRLDRENFITEVIDRLRSELDELGIQADITGRPKHIYSIWRKMKFKHLAFNQIFDVRAVRVLVNDVRGCYAALGIAHTLWKPIPGEFDDYIATPKDNMYQSLHTAVMGPHNKTVEIQIRTHEMHEHAELGVAAHWRYKEGSKHDASFQDRIAWLRQLLEWKDETDDADDFLDRFKSEIFEDRVYILTPKGEVIDLPKGATPLDFAYYIHTDVGHRCRGAKVDGRIVPLTYTLQNSETVEVMTTKQAQPRRDWMSQHMGYLATSRARAKVRAWFKLQDHDQNLLEGRETFERELRRLGIESVDEKRLMKRFNFQAFDDVLISVGRGEISTAQIASSLEVAPQAKLRSVPRRDARAKAAAQDQVVVRGVGNLLTQMAKCCGPVPGDLITGYITQGRGVTIHRCDCPSLMRMEQRNPERLIEVHWGGQNAATYPVDIIIQAYDRQGLLSDVSSLLSNADINVLGSQTATDPSDHMARMTLTLEINDLAQLSRVLDRIAQLRNVVEVRRKT